MDVDRSTRAGSSVRGARITQVTGVRGSSNPDSRDRDRVQRSRVRLLQPDDVTANKRSRSCLAAALSSPRPEPVRVHGAVSGNGLLSRAFADTFGGYRS